MVGNSQYKQISTKQKKNRCYNNSNLMVRSNPNHVYCFLVLIQEQNSVLSDNLNGGKFDLFSKSYFPLYNITQKLRC